MVDEHQQTSVPGLYAAGDVVKALNQMSVGVGHAPLRQPPFTEACQWSQANGFAGDSGGGVSPRRRWPDH